MIQRIQSLYLLLGALLIIALITFLRYLWAVPGAEVFPGYALTVTVLGALVAVLALAAIFLNKDPRFPNKMKPGLKRQRKVVVAVQVIEVLFLLVFFGGLYASGSLPLLSDPGGVAALLIPVGAYVCFFMARRSIDKDIRQLEKVDQFRLRD
jgi:polyferredoxin